jgi:Tol biopolymer transport system component
MPLEPGRFTRVEVATRKETILFEEPRVGDTSCSADGRIVGYSYSAANGTSFRVRNVETGALTDVPLPSPVSAVALSPDGAQLAYIGAASGALSIKPLNGGASREVARARAPELFLAGTVLAWSRDGEYVYFVKHPSGTSDSEVFRVRANGGTEERLGINGADLRNLSISPDGSRIAFVMGPRNRPEIWAIENTSAAR